MDLACILRSSELTWNQHFHHCIYMDVNMYLYGGSDVCYQVQNVSLYAPNIFHHWQILVSSLSSPPSSLHILLYKHTTTFRGFYTMLMLFQVSILFSHKLSTKVRHFLE